MEMMELLKKVTAASVFTHAAGVEVVAAEVRKVTLAPANGEKISATAQCVQTGSTLCGVSVTVSSIRGGEAKVCAISTVTWRVVDMPLMA